MSFIAVLLLLATLLLPATTSAAAAAKHSGSIMTVGAGGHEITTGGFQETPLAAADLRPGEFATVTAVPRAGRLVALSVAVVAPR